MSDRGDAEPTTSENTVVDLSSWRKVEVSGTDSQSWLDSMVSADLSGLAPGHARHTLLLSPTGRIRAGFTVSAPAPARASAPNEVPAGSGSLLLLQDPVQPNAIDRLLAPYVLSSDVVVTDRSVELALFAFPGASGSPLPTVARAALSEPSCLGEGVDLIASRDDHGRVLAALSGVFALAGEADAERWRIMAGTPRFGVDADGDDLPQDAGFTGAVSFDKGCFVGQEAVAKVRNLGHPRRVLLHLRADRVVAPGEPVVADGGEVGRVTSATAADGGTVVLASVRWANRDGRLSTASGVPLRATGLR